METNTRKSNLPAIAFALAALVATHPSTAFANNEPPSEKVHYGDLNLASEDGIKALDRRLDRAVQRVCGQATVRELYQQQAIEKCRKDTMRSIQGEREFAIATANGSETWAESAPRGRTRVSLAE